MATLERAIEIAHEAHAKDKPRRNGEPYVAHPMRVMEKARKLGYPVRVLIVCALHDVPENNEDWQLERLRAEGYEDEVLVPLDHVTRREGEEWSDYIHRVAQNQEATMVKELDMEDNLEDDPTEKQVRKYGEAALVLARMRAIYN